MADRLVEPASYSLITLTDSNASSLAPLLTLDMKSLTSFKIVWPGLRSTLLSARAAASPGLVACRCDDY